MASLLDQVTNPDIKLEDYIPGPNSRYKTVEDLTKGKYEADLHIKNLETRLDELREDFVKEHEANTQRTTMEALMEEIKKMQTSPPPSAQPVEPKQESLSPDQIKSLMSQTILDQKKFEREEQNLESVQSKLIEQFGKNYQSAYKDKLDQLGLSAEEADNMARRQPKVLIESLGLTRKPVEQFQSPMRSSVTQLRTPSEGKKTMSYYKELRKNNPKAYHDPRINQEMHDMAIQMGKDFFDDGEPFME